MAAAPAAAALRDVPCPFCGLACDDLEIDAGGPVPRVLAAGCPLARAGFERAPAAATPRLDGRDCTIDEAVARAAAILGASRQPLFAGLAADVAGIGAALQLADRLGGVVDHAGSAALFRNLPAQRELGWVATTLSAEVRNRADLVLLVGPDPLAAAPRFVERCVAPARRCSTRRPGPRLIRLGPPAPAPALPANVALTDIACPLEALPAAVAALRCLLAGQPVARAAGRRGRAGRLAAALGAARYATVAWSAAALALPDADLLIQGRRAGAHPQRDDARRGAAAGRRRQPDRRQPDLPLADRAAAAHQLRPRPSRARSGAACGRPDHRRRRGGRAGVDLGVPPGRDPISGRHSCHRARPRRWTRLRAPAVLIPVGTPGSTMPAASSGPTGWSPCSSAPCARASLPSVAEILGRIDRALGDRDMSLVRLAGGRIVDPANGRRGEVATSATAASSPRRSPAPASTRPTISPAASSCRVASTSTAISRAARSTSPVR
ncbi:MAG: hypothetical protein U1E53_09485 [Dongiaceae bacterium]